MKEIPQTLDCRQNRRTLFRKLLIRTAPVRRKVKPAEMLRIQHRYTVCPAHGAGGFCVYQKEILTVLNLEYRILNRSKTSSLVLFFDRALLEKALAPVNVCRRLAAEGYPADAPLDRLLDRLAARFHETGSVPHEVGFFLGYPFKDVVGFINNDPPTASGHWKVFGDPAESFRLMRLHRAAEREAHQRFVDLTANEPSHPRSKELHYA